MIRTLAILLIVAATVLLAVRVFLVYTLDDAAAKLDGREEQLDEILRIVQSNSNVCFVSILRPIETICPDASAPQDRRDYETIVKLMLEVGIDSLNVNPPTPNLRPARYVEFGVYEQTRIPFTTISLSAPIVGVWNLPGYDVMQRTDCKLLRTGWRVCYARAVVP